MSQRSDQVILQSMGEMGCVGNSGTSAQTGPFIAIQFVTAGAFTAIDMNGNNAGTGLTGVTFPAQFTLLGQINSYTLTSGTVVHYKGAFP